MLSLGPNDIAGYVEKPLRVLPAEWRIPVWKFWASYSHLLPSQLALTMRLRGWIDGDGLTLGEAVRAFDFLNRPEQAAQIEYAGQLLAHLAAAVVRAMEDRRRRERIAATDRDPRQDVVGAITRNFGELPK